jgi:hypothetical protein
MATPNYLGRGQPSADSVSWLSWLGGTPAYKGAGQPSSKTSTFGTAPAYKPAPTVAAPGAMTSTSGDPSACGTGPIAIVIPREVIEQ